MLPPVRKRRAVRFNNFNQFLLLKLNILIVKVHRKVQIRKNKYIYIYIYSTGIELCLTEAKHTEEQHANHLSSAYKRSM